MTQTVTPEYLYKIVSPELWQQSQSQNEVLRSAIDDGFIHLSKEDQVDHVARKFWNNMDYVVLTLESEKLVGRLVYEQNPGGSTFYYHLYDGKIPLDAVVEARMLRANKS